MPNTHHTDIRRWPYLLLAWVSLALGVVGIFLPVFPTVPFILLASWAAARGSQRLHDWLYAHRVFGPMLKNWERDGAVSRRAKWAASVTMLISAAFMWWLAEAHWPPALVTLVMATVAVWLWRRPEPAAAGPNNMTSGAD